MLTKDKLKWHMERIRGLPWSFVAGNKGLGKALEILQGEISKIEGRLELYFQRLDRRTSIPAPPRTTESCGGTLRAFTNDDKSEKSIIEPRASCRRILCANASVQARLQRKAINALDTLLQNSAEYTPIYLSDAQCGIHVETTQDAHRRALQRSRFRQELSEGFRKFAVGLYVKSAIGPYPAFVAIFKIPSDYGSSKAHHNRYFQAMKQCDSNAPNFISKQKRTEFNNLMHHVTTMRGAKLDALRACLLGDDTSSFLPAQQRQAVLFFEQVASGQTICEDMFMDLRKLKNSRGGNGEGSTSFGEFWEACRRVINSEVGVGAHERRTKDSSDVVYASSVVSIRDLIEQVARLFDKEVESGKRQSVPPIPSDEWVRLQFAPSNDLVTTAGKLTGRLNVIRKMQTRTLRKEHPDQHWNNSFTNYRLSWVAELITLQQGSVEFLGQDDKCKINVGNDIALTAMNRRGRNGAIVKNGVEVKAGDHDFSFASIVPSVTLFCNIPKDVGGSFYGGGKDGKGQLEVTLCDAIFDASDVFNHTAQLVESCRRQNLSMYTLLLQTDGGPDHSLKYLRTQLALLALFFTLDVDHLVAIRGAPGGSYLNKAERGMSLLNFGLENLSLVREPMPKWAEDAVSGAQTMKDVRSIASKLDQRKMRQKRMDTTVTRTWQTTMSSSHSLQELDRKRRHAAKANGWECGELIPLYQGEKRANTNACVVITYLIVAHHLRSSGGAVDVSGICRLIAETTPSIIIKYNLRDAASTAFIDKDAALDVMFQHVWPSATFCIHREELDIFSCFYTLTPNSDESSKAADMRLADSGDGTKREETHLNLKAHLTNYFAAPSLEYQVAAMFFGKHHSFSILRLKHPHVKTFGTVLLILWKTTP